MTRKSIFAAILLTISCSIFLGRCDDTCSACSAQPQQDNNIEDEIMTNEDKDSFQEMMDEIASKAEPVASPEKTCPFANGGGMDPLGAMAMGGMGTLSGMAMPPMAGALPPDVDPKELSLALLSILDSLQARIQQALDEHELGVYSQIRPINMFLSPNPYAAYQDVLSTTEGEEAMTKIGYLQTDLKNYLNAA